MVKHYKNYITIFLFANLLLSQASLSPETLEADSVKKPLESKTLILSSNVELFDVDPTAYRISVYPRSRPAEPYMTKVFFPEEPIQIILPSDILSKDSLGNVFKIEPLGSNLDPQFRFFDSSEEDIKITTFKVVKPTDRLKILVLDANSMQSIPNAKVTLFQNGIVYLNAVTDSMGYLPGRIPKDRDMTSPVNITVDTGDRYSLWQESFIVPKGENEKEILLSKSEIEKGESIYYAVDDYSPLRLGPENGSQVLFFLNRKDEIAISKVAGSRLYGRTRVYLSDKGLYQNIFGWVQAEDVAFKNK